MSRSVTVQSVVDQAKILCQDPDHILGTQAEYITFLDQEHCRLYAYYVAAEPDRYRAEQTILTSTSPATVPADWLLTIAIDFVSGSVRHPLERLQEQHRNRYINLSGGEARAYRIIGNTVMLYPTPPAGQEYLHIYMPTAPVLALPATQIDCRLGHEKWLAMCTARMLLNSENSYDGRWDEEINKLEQELKLEANYRYFHDMARMDSDVGQRMRYWPYNYPFGVRW